MNSRNKGKRGELLWRDILISQGYPAARGQQFHGGPGSPDVVCDGLAKYHMEVKFVEKLAIREAITQAIRDAGSKVPMVVHKVKQQDWLVTMLASDWFKLVKGTI